MLIWAEVHGLALLRNEGVIAAMAGARGRTEKQTIDAMFRIMKGRFIR